MKGEMVELVSHVGFYAAVVFAGLSIVLATRRSLKREGARLDAWLEASATSGRPALLRVDEVSFYLSHADAVADATATWPHQIDSLLIEGIPHRVVQLGRASGVPLVAVLAAYADDPAVPGARACVVCADRRQADALTSSVLRSVVVAPNEKNVDCRVWSSSRATSA